MIKNIKFYIMFEQAFACARFQLIDLAHPLDPIGWAEIEFDQIGKLWDWIWSDWQTFISSPQSSGTCPILCQPDFFDKTPQSCHACPFLCQPEHLFEKITFITFLKELPLRSQGRNYEIKFLGKFVVNLPMDPAYLHSACTPSHPPEQKLCFGLELVLLVIWET